MEASDPVNPRARHQRSPNYPGIGLEQAIERARVIYRKEGRNTAPVEAVMDHWNYSPKSSGGRTVLAALRNFGLLAGRGSEVSLTKNALAILLDERTDSSDRDEAIALAALTPSIHQQLWDKYGGSLPSDETLSFHLRADRGFTDGAAKEFIRQFRGTIEFAKLGQPGITPPADQERLPIDEDDRDPMTFPAIAAPSVHEQRSKPVTDAPLPINVNLAGGGWATLRLSRRISEAEWTQMMAVMTASKPGLTDSDS